MKTDLILIGGGGHCRACIDVVEAENIHRIDGIVDVPEKKGTSVLGYPVVACDEDLPALATSVDGFLIAMGQIKTCQPRTRLYQRLKALKANLPVVVSPRAQVSPHAIIGEGTIVLHAAVLNAGADVGSNCIINTRALVEHDVRIGSHCHIATAAVVNGGATIGSETFIGSMAMIRQLVQVGQRCVVGAGAVVMADVPDGTHIAAGEIFRGKQA